MTVNVSQVNHVHFIFTGRLDEKANAVRVRIGTTLCLRAADAVYMRSCYRSFLKGCSTRWVISQYIILYGMTACLLLTY